MKKFFKALSLIMAIVISGVFSAGAVIAKDYVEKGIDVSYWQGDVNFKKVKSAGIDFVILRVGTSYGKDSSFEKNYEKAKEAGIEVGCYFYTYAKTVEEAQKEAKDVVSWIGKKQLEYPVYFDIEDASLESLSKADKMNIIDAFISSVSKYGFLSGLYCNYNWLKYHLNEKVIKEKYEVWLASWTDSGKPDVDKSSECSVWQYSASGSVDGITTAVDMNVSYFDYPGYIKDNGLNNYPKSTEDTGDEPVEQKDDNPLEAQFNVLKIIFARLMEVVKLIAILLGAA